MTKLRTLGTLVVPKLVILSNLFLTSFILAWSAEVSDTISFSTSFILVLRVILVAKLVISGILSSIFLISALYTSFLTTSFFTTPLNLLKSTGTSTSLSTSNLSTFSNFLN